MIGDARGMAVGYRVRACPRCLCQIYRSRNWLSPWTGGCMPLRLVGSRFVPGVVLGVALSMFLVAASSAKEDTGAAGVTTRDGVFTQEQAEGARSVYMRECAACHGNNLGGTANAPALRGFAFEFYWNGRTLGELVTYMQSTMPLTAPGSLSRGQVVNLVALILQENGFESGDEPLPSDAEILESITFIEPEVQEE